VNNQTNLASNLPSYTALSASTGAGSFSYALPLEFAKGYGVLRPLTLRCFRPFSSATTPSPVCSVRR
jgi:hypothetical protein